MQSGFDKNVERAIRSLLARESYEQGCIRIAQPDLDGFWWLVTSNKGIFGIALDRVELIVHGWFFGICRHAGFIYAFENCGMRDRTANLGRIIRIRQDGSILSDPEILVAGLHGNCHHLKVIDDVLCLVDTGNQCVRRYTLDGEVVDVKTPFPPADDRDTSGAYLHINCLAQLGDRIGLMLHNGKAEPARKSEVAWFDRNWTLQSMQQINGHSCHDIVVDAQDTIWHSASDTGDLMTDDGRRFSISDSHMTRALAFCHGHMLVGLSSFGPRQHRDILTGQVALLDSQAQEIVRLELPAGPSDALALF